MNSFEELLSQLKREELPVEWKEDLLNSTLGEDSDEPGTSLFGPFSRATLGAIAACWIAVCALFFSTPSDPESSEIANRFGISPDELPLLVVRWGGDSGSDLSFRNL